jgi:hypothetical protein
VKRPGVWHRRPTIDENSRGSLASPKRLIANHRSTSLTADAAVSDEVLVTE